MTEKLTQTYSEDVLADTNDFLQTERGASLDGGFASQQIAERVLTTQERAEALLTSVPHPKLAGLYVPLSKHNAAYYDEAAAVLPGHFVLVPSAMVDTAPAAFYPAVVSEDGIAAQQLRLHVLKQPYRQQLRYGTAMMLSAAGQSETAGIGDHGRTNSDSIEAEHFATLLAAGSDAQVKTAWQRGEHVNHAWRDNTQDSVVAEVSGRLFSEDAPQTTLTVTKAQVASGQAMLLWHEGMRDADTGQPEAATQPNALVVVQGLGYEALRSTSPHAIDNLKEMIA